MPLVDLSTLGWGTVLTLTSDGLLDGRLKVVADQAFVLKDANDVTVLSGETDENGQIVGSLAPGTYTLEIGGNTKTVDVPPVPATVNVKDFGAAGDGTGDDGPAILEACQAAIANASFTTVSINEVFFPPGIYSIDDTLVLDNFPGLKFVGCGTMQARVSRIQYQGTGTAISAKSAIGFNIEGLHIEGYSADLLLDLSRDTVAPIGDTSLVTIRDSWLRSDNGSDCVLVKLSDASVVEFDRVNFWGGDRAADSGADPGSPDYFSNLITFTGCHFSHHGSHPIHNPIQSWRVLDCEFECLEDGSAGAVEYDVTADVAQMYDFTFRGNRCEDADATGSWIKLASTTYGGAAAIGAVNIVGNLFTTGEKHVEITGATAIPGLIVEGNTMIGGSVAVDLGACVPTSSRIGPNRSTATTYLVGTLGAGSVLVDDTQFKALSRVRSGSYLSAHDGTADQVLVGYIGTAAGRGIAFGAAADIAWSIGAGTPEGNRTGKVGSLYTRTDGGAGTTLYVKESGTGNTGWVAK